MINGSITTATYCQENKDVRHTTCVDILLVCIYKYSNKIINQLAIVCKKRAYIHLMKSNQIKYGIIINIYLSSIVCNQWKPRK